MRWLMWLVLAAAGVVVVAQEKALDELEHVRVEAEQFRKAAAADPTIKDLHSPPVKAYLAEQQLRRLRRLAGLRKRISEFQNDPSKQSLVPILQKQLAEFETKPLEQVSFDSAYGYQPTTGLVGYSKKVRLLENTADGKSIILVDNVALTIAGLGTSNYASGKFFGVDKAILIGAPGPDFLFQGSNRKSYSATLFDLESVLGKKR